MYPILITYGTLEISSYPVFLTLGLLLGLLVGIRQAKSAGIRTHQILAFGATVVPVALLLGLLNGVLFDQGFIWSLFHRHKFFIHDGGLVSFGIILGALLTGWGFARLFKNPIRQTLDWISLVLPLMLGVTRIGCLLNGCCYGREIDGFWGMYLPGRYGKWDYIYPTQIFLMILDFSLFAWLWKRKDRCPTEGSQTLLFLVVFSTGRILIDGLRDLPPVLGSLNMHQSASLAILLATVTALLFWKRRERASTI